MKYINKYKKVLFVDDALSNIEQCDSFCETLHISERNGITNNDIKYIEKSIYIYNEDEIKNILSIKPQEIEDNDNDGNNSDNHDGIKSINKKPRKKKKSWKDKYKLENVPKWFDDLNKNDDEPAVIEINQDSFPDFSNGFHINHNDQLNFPQNHQLEMPTKFTFGNDD